MGDVLQILSGDILGFSQQIPDFFLNLVNLALSCSGFLSSAYVQKGNAMNSNS